MERALDPQLLSSALGDAGMGLPTPTELATQIAQVERDLLAGRGAVAPELLRVAWYLHAVASSYAAVERYGVGRQRDAFRVASHVFDLSLAAGVGESSDWNDVFRRCFAAQVASYRSDLDPNSIALYRRTASLQALRGLRPQLWPASCATGLPCSLREILARAPSPLASIAGCDCSQQRTFPLLADFLGLFE